MCLEQKTNIHSTQLHSLCQLQVRFYADIQLIFWDSVRL